MTRERFDLLVEHFKKAEKFYSDPYQPQTKKDAWRPKMEAMVDELAAEYGKLLAEGKVGPGDLPEATEASAQMILNAKDVTDDYDMKDF